MKSLKASALAAVMLLCVSLFTGCKVYNYGPSEPQTVYENPQWAPPYYQGARYYYLPDIETYYDLYSREFIFLNNAQWIYSPYISPYYSAFDLNNCFVIIVNTNIYQPWMHHQYYVSHFPRYYYHDYYDHSNIPYVRGFNENSKSAIYWAENERDRARSWDDDNLRNNRQFKYSEPDRQHQINTNNQAGNRQSRENTGNDRTPQTIPDNRRNTSGNTGDKTVTPQPTTTPRETKRTDNTNYYGKPIGQPVKVERQMRNPTETKSTDRGTNTSKSSDTRTNQHRK
jgi:hypothetical protein